MMVGSRAGTGPSCTILQEVESFSLLQGFCVAALLCRTFEADLFPVTTLENVNNLLLSMILSSTGKKQIACCLESSKSVSSVQVMWLLGYLQLRHDPTLISGFLVPALPVE